MFAAFLLATGIGAQAYVLPPPGADGWRPLAFPRVERQTRYERVEFDSGPALRAQARCSASALLHAVPGLDLARTPWLRWRWRVDRDLPPRDARTRAGDDYAARVYVAFRFEPERASAFERLRRAALRLVYGAELPGRALNYVWFAGQPEGRDWASPYAPQARLISLGAGPPGAFRDARVDLRADYRRLFGSEPPAVEFVAVMSDADDGCGETLAWFADLRFAPE
jgi:hypothetical protein